MNPRDPNLQRTPALERLLAALKRRLALHVWLHGLGTVTAVSGAWLLFAFVADWGLRVPGPVRMLHGLIFLGMLGFFLWRDLIRPLRRIPVRPDLAVLIERAHPDLRELLVSAAQFQQPLSHSTADPHGAPELIQLVLGEADRRAAGLSPLGALDERTPRSRFLLGGVAVLLIGGFSALNPEYAAIFVDRMFGGGAPWPQRTHLDVRIPLHDETARIEATSDRIHVRVARGTDVPVLVRANGVVPSDVTLHFEGGRDMVLSPSGGGVFRTLLRSCQEDLAFHATGGDDRDGLPEVQIEVLQPPDVEGVALVVQPPEYCGLPASVAFNRDVEVVAGSRVRVHVLPTPPDAQGSARILPDDRSVDLVPAPFPVDPAAASDGGAPEGEERQGLAFELVADRSIGYRFELVDATGLANPDPGLFRIHVVEDRTPDVRLLAPGRTDYETVIGGAIPVRARAEDDFGLVSMAWAVTPVKRGEQADAAAPLLEGAFDARPGTGPEAEGEEATAWLASTRIEVDDLAPEGAEVALDQRFLLQVTARDNKRPDPGEGRSVPVRVRLVSADELLRRMQDRLARARLDAGRLAELQREKRRRVEELLDSIKGDSPLEAGDDLALNSAAIGQRRVQSDAQSLARELASVAEDILYTRLDDKAGALLEFLHARLAEIGDQAFHPEPWRELAAAHAAGELGSPGFSGNLVHLVDLALQVSEDHARGASAAVDRAQKAVEVAEIQSALIEAVELQTASLERIEDLLEQLAEWDNFQNVLALTRDILSRQKALRDRTKQFAKEKQ